MKVVWIAGAIRGDNGWQRENNIRRAEQLAMRVWQTGMAAICVHSFCRPYAIGDEAEEMFLPGDLAILERSDAVLVVPLSGASTGTLGEISHAESIGIPVFYWFDDLKEWADAT